MIHMMTFTPWLFYLLLSVTIIILVLGLGWLMQKGIKNLKKEGSKRWERGGAVLLAILMIGFYFWIAEGFTDRASYGETIVTPQGFEQVEEGQKVLIPFSSYLVIERLYEFGFAAQEEVNGEVINIRLFIEDPPSLLQEFPECIDGDGVFTNHARFDFRGCYEGHWQSAIVEELQQEDSLEQASRDIEGMFPYFSVGLGSE
ncbi:hypothetical protein [Bacillus sp. FJAT-44742]|uniref:hypothetical protein n=1 Tax=Bacillus sp. FJAT-44742 TaxID=2014005 RepID=UPI0018E257E3|nr:hypothetical protein [Bacillus sp. FJAT-44742]